MSIAKMPLVIAHRGFSTFFPENTFAAFDAALAQPIDGIELDIQGSADETPVLYHDRTLYKVGGGLRRVHGQKLADLRDLDFGGWLDTAFKGEPLRLLDELLAQYGGRTRLLLEVKVRDRNRQRLSRLVARVVDTVAQRNLFDSTELLCFDPELLAFAHQRQPRMRTVLNQDRGRVLDNHSWLYAYSANIRNLSKTFVTQAHAADKPVYTFTSDTEKQLKRALDCGVDAVMSNNPAWLAQQLGRQAAPVERP